ncbi:MAG: hypothetical protein K0R22_2926, partial [Sporomusa sp.]|nr:hypothetical protein [Sporomusa sp.]
TIINLEYGEPYAVKVACTVREGAGYFVNPPISSLYATLSCNFHAIFAIPRREHIRKTANAVFWLCTYQIIQEHKGMVLLLALPGSPCFFAYVKL